MDQIDPLVEQAHHTFFADILDAFELTDRERIAFVDIQWHELHRPQSLDQRAGRPQTTVTNDIITDLWIFDNLVATIQERRDDRNYTIVLCSLHLTDQIIANIRQSHRRTIQALAPDT